MSAIQDKEGLWGEHFKPRRPLHLFQPSSDRLPGDLIAPLSENLDRRQRDSRIMQLILSDQGKAERSG